MQFSEQDTTRDIMRVHIFSLSAVPLFLRLERQRLYVLAEVCELVWVLS
jgi:hypothetical protein